MPDYSITISPDEVSQEFRVMLRGPGIDSDGRYYIFASKHRCAAFVEAVNFAYQQGLRDGLDRRKSKEGRLLIVTGATPETLGVRTEGWLSRWKRRWLRRVNGL